MDIALFRFINGFAGSCTALDVLGIFFARGLIFVIALIPFYVLAREWWPTEKRVHAQRVLLQAIVAVAFGLADNAIAGVLFFRERPFVALDAVNQLISAPLTAKSFPSDHALIVGAIAMTVFLSWPKVGKWALGAAGLVALARVYVGVHYVSDVVVGLLVGMAWAWIVHVFVHYRKHHKVKKVI